MSQLAHVHDMLPKVFIFINTIIISYLSYYDFPTNGYYLALALVDQGYNITLNIPLKMVEHLSRTKKNKLIRK